MYSPIPCPVLKATALRVLTFIVVMGNEENTRSPQVGAARISRSAHGLDGAASESSNEDQLEKPQVETVETSRSAHDIEGDKTSTEGTNSLVTGVSSDEQLEKRWSAGTFPVLSPGDSIPDDLPPVDLIDSVEYVEIHSFIRDKYDMFRSTCPADTDESEEVRRSKWIRECYWTHCLDYLLSKSLRAGELAHRFVGNLFIPLLTPSSVEDEDIKFLAQGLMTEVQPQDLPHISKLFFSSWADFAPFMRNMKMDKEEAFSQFTRLQYWITIKNVLKERQESHRGRA